jgi:Na+-driven multidrug efflux pump
MLGFSAGLAGTAAATVAAQAVLLTLPLAFLQGGRSLLGIMKKAIRPHTASVEKTVIIGALAELSTAIQLAVFAVAKTEHRGVWR